MSADEMTAWLRTQVEDVKALAVAAMACAEVKDGRWFDEEDEITDDNGLRLATVNSPPVTTHIAANDPRSVIADCDAKLALLDRYDMAVARGDLSYDYRTGRQSAAEIRWNDLLVLTGGYRHREGWRDSWPVPQIFQ